MVHGLSTDGFGTTLLCFITLCKWWTEQVKNLVTQGDICTSVIDTELIDRSKLEKWNWWLITATDEAVAIEMNQPLRALLLADCCSIGKGREGEKLKFFKKKKEPPFSPLTELRGRCERREDQLQNFMHENRHVEEALQ